MSALEQEARAHGDIRASDRPERARLPADGETAIWAPIGQDAVLIAAASEPLPSPTVALLNGEASAIEIPLVTWRRTGTPDEAAAGFVCLAPLASLQRARLASILLRRPGRPIRLALGRKAMTPSVLFSAIAEDAGPDFPPVMDGILELLLKGVPGPRHLQAALSLIQLSAEPGGFVEILGALDDERIFLQGWSSDLTPGRTRLLVTGGLSGIAKLEAATFPRADVGGTARGFLGLLDGKLLNAKPSDGKPSERPGRHDPAEIQRLFFRARGGWRALEIYDRRVVLDALSVPGHIRDGLLRATGPADVVEGLREAGHRFDGRDTLSALERPVRLGLDVAAALEGAGLLVTGWLFDPDRQVRSVTLRMAGASTRIDEDWTRVSRPDVTAIFASDGRFSPLVRHGEDHHGFVAFAPDPRREPGKPVYLEFAFDDSPPAYFPLEPSRTTMRRAVDGVLAGLDPRTASTTAVIERQVASVLRVADLPAPRVIDAIDHGYAAAKGELALIIGMDRTPRDLAALFAHLAVDPETRAVPIVIAGPASMSDWAGMEVRRLAGFYGLSVRFVLADGVEDACDALEAGIGAAEANGLVLMSGAAQPRARGWLGTLVRMWCAHGGNCMASPTLVFEDDSIRWAGTCLDGEGDRHRIANRFLGYPVDAIGNLEPAEVLAGAAECCVVARAAFEQVGGFTRNYLNATDKGLDLGLKLRREGIPSIWVPEVQIYLPEDPAGRSAPHVARLAQLADRVSFEERWSPTLADMKA